MADAVNDSLRYPESFNEFLALMERWHRERDVTVRQGETIDCALRRSAEVIQAVTDVARQVWANAEAARAPSAAASGQAAVQEVQPAGWEVRVHCSRGERTIRAGMQWRDGLYGSTWEVVEPKGERIYSPSGFGGTPTFWCRPVGDLPEGAKRWLEQAREDGCVGFCGDSIAAGLIEGAASQPSAQTDDALEVLRELVDVIEAIAKWKSSDGVPAYRALRAREVAAWDRARKLVKGGAA